jgi:integrase
LEKRRRRWYAVLDIPKDVRPSFDGKPRFVKSLETESLTLAQRRVSLLISGWKGEIEAARTGSTDPIEDEIRWYRRNLPQMSDEQREAELEGLLEKAKRMEVKDTGDAHGVVAGAGVSFYKRATGEVVGTADHVEEWIGTLVTGNEPKTRDMKRSDALRMAGRFPVLADIKKPEVRRWVNELAQNEEKPLKPKTITRIISHSRGYWAYLQSLQLVRDDVEPFHSVGQKVSRKSKAAKASERRAFKAADVVTLLRAAEVKGDPALTQLIWLGMWTGCRIEELCALRCEKVHDDHVEVDDAKSPSGWRLVPIHSRLRDAMKQAVEDSLDGYVISGLTFNKYEDRSNAVSKRFGHLKRRLDFGPQYVFHSLRKTVATLLQQAGVSEDVAAGIVGHGILTMTYGLYAEGVTLKQKAEAIELIDYPV